MKLQILVQTKSWFQKDNTKVIIDDLRTHEDITKAQEALEIMKNHEAILKNSKNEKKCH